MVVISPKARQQTWSAVLAALFSALTVAADTEPFCTSARTVISSATSPLSADLAEVLCACVAAVISPAIAVVMSAVSLAWEACALRSRIVWLYAVSAVPVYALQPGSLGPSSLGTTITAPTASTATAAAPPISRRVLPAGLPGCWSVRTPGCAASGKVSGGGAGRKAPCGGEPWKAHG